MTINYLDILIEYKKLTLPTVGSFSILYHSATIDKAENLIYPPYKQVVYSLHNEEIDYSPEIAAYLEMKMGLPFSDAVRISKEESFSFSEKKNSSSIIPIAGLGRLFKGKQGEWMFTPDDIEIFKEERKGFPVVSYIPSGRSATDAVTSALASTSPPDTVSTVATSPAITPKSKRGAFTWWPFSLAAVVLLGSFFLWQKQSSKDSAYKVFRMASPESRVNVKPLDNDRLYPDNVEELDGTKIDSSRFYEGEEAQEDLEALTDNPNDFSNSDEIDQEELSNILKDKPSSDIIISEIPVRNSSLGPEDCLVIVGAFANPENVEKMKEKLLAYGTDIVTDTDIKLTRVGIMIPCNSDELPHLLERLRSEINNASWVMRKK